MSGHIEKIDTPSEMNHEPVDGTTTVHHHGRVGEELPVLWMHDPDQYPGAMESLRAFKNKLIKLKENKGYVNYLLTGCDPGAGTSTVVFNLAVLLAQDLPDKRILVVDTNVRRPTLHRVFDVAQEPGLTDALLTSLTVDQVIRDSFLSNLDVIAVGQTEHTSPSPYDLVEFTEFLARVKKQYEFVLFDSAPALQSSLTRSIYSKTDGVVLVVEADRTRWEVVMELKRLIHDDGATLLGAFLNRRKFPIPKWLYQYI